MPGTNAAFKSEAHAWAEDEVPALRSKLDTSAGSPVKNKEKTSGYLKAVPDAEIGGVAEERLHQMTDEKPNAPLMDCHFEVASTPKEIGKRLAQARKAAKMTQQEVADKTNSHKEAVGRLERGQTNPTLETVMGYAQAVGLSGGFAFFDREPT